MNMLKQSIGSLHTGELFINPLTGEYYVEKYGNHFVYEVTYDSGGSTFLPAARLSYLCNNTPNADTIIFGVGSDFKFVSGPAIMDNGGVTMLIQNGIFCFYDTTACDGQNYWTAGAGGEHVQTPTDALLFHELSHAYYAITKPNSMPSSSLTFAQRSALESVVIADENGYRDLASPPLKHRDPTLWTLGGCGAPEAKDGNGWCFIINASYGTVSAERAYEFRRFRDQVIRRTSFGRAAFEQFFAEYYRFSPSIAVDMAASEALTRSVREYFVEPFLDYLSCVREICAQSNSSVCVRTLRATLAARRSTLRDPLSTACVAAILADWRNCRAESPDAAGSTAEATALYLLERILEVPDAVLVPWALIDGSRIYYDALVSNDDGAALMANVLDWMARLPTTSRAIPPSEAGRVISNPEAIDALARHIQGES